MGFNLAVTGAFVILIFIFVFAAILISHLLAPHNPDEGDKRTPYECAERPITKSWIRYNFRFYLIAILFIIFDVEIVFVYPVAVVYKKWIEANLGRVALWELFIFILVLLAGLIYAWGKGDITYVKKIPRGEE